jgi:hypothetical protein
VIFRKPTITDTSSKPLHLQALDYPFQADLTRFSSSSILPDQGLTFSIGKGAGRVLTPALEFPGQYLFILSPNAYNVDVARKA